MRLVAERDVYCRRVIFATWTDRHFLTISKFSTPVAVFTGYFVYFSLFIVGWKAVNPVKFFLVKFVLGESVDVDAI